MDDGILHAIVYDGEAVLLLVHASAAAGEAQKLLQLSNGVTNALGRLICAAATLAQRNKDESEKLTLIVSGGGAAGKLLVTADNTGRVKACADQPQATSPSAKIDLPALVGTDGRLTVVRDNPLGKEPYVGMCDLVKGDITRDFAAYLVSSEQQPAAVAFDCGMQDGTLTCGGMTILPLPGCRKETLDEVEKKITSLNDLLARFRSYLTLEEMALDLFWNVGVKPLETAPLAYRCDCSRERFENGLLSLGKKELLSLAAEGQAEIRCRFCNKVYRFSGDELKSMAKDL